MTKELWGEAIMAANYLRNRSPTVGTKEDKTPYEIFKGKKPNIENLRVWGCKCSVFIPDNQRGKLDSKVWEGHLVGYAETQKGWRIWNSARRGIIVSRDVKFYEKEIMNYQPPSHEDDVLSWDEGREQETLPQEHDEEERVALIPIPMLPRRAIDNRNEVGSGNLDPSLEIEPELDQPEENAEVEQNVQENAEQEDNESNVETEVVPRRSTRERKMAEKFSYSKLGVPETNYSSYLANLEEDNLSYTQAINSEQKELWREAIEKEFNSLAENQTWELTRLPPGRKAIGSKWVFRVKPLPEGGLKYKARLVAKGYSQVEGVDYTETFAPVIKYKSLRILLALANEYNMQIHQMDVTTAFLYGDLKEDIYMHQPEGCVVPGSEGLVCKLKRSLYGLKQSPRCWNQKIHGFLSKQGFKETQSDTALYTKGTGRSKILIGLYVDDLLIASEDESAIRGLKEGLQEVFKMTDIGDVNTVLGIKIQRNREKGTLTMSQQKYVEDILKRFNMSEAKGKATPMEVGLKFSDRISEKRENDAETMARIPYRQAVGSIMYLMVCTRPDIASAVQMVSRFGADPRPVHWKAVQRIFKYLVHTKDYGLTFKREGSVKLTGFCDSDWGGCEDTRRSTTGYMFKLGGACVSWCSRRQKTVALSSCEAEFMAACEAAKEAIWEKQLLSELGWEQEEPVPIWTDSQSAIALINNPTFHDKSKHIEIRHFFIREKVNAGWVTYKYCETETMVADSLTKGVPRVKTEYCRERMGVLKVEQ